MKPIQFYLLIAGLFLGCAAPLFAQENVVYRTDSLFAHEGTEEKNALVLMHFGTTHDDTRSETLDKINALAKSSFSDIIVTEAYTSRIIAKRLRDRGIRKELPGEVLERLKEEGVTRVLIQPTQLINGVEMESVRRDVEAYEPYFKEIRLSSQLLDTPEDYKALAKILTGEGRTEGQAYLWVGHGTYDVSTAQYAMLDYLLTSEGYANHVIATIEGYPSMTEALRRLKATGLHKVTVSPLLLVSGEHAKNDIANDVTGILKENGFEVEVDLRGLGEYPAVRQLFVDKAAFTATHKKLDIMNKKKQYAITGEKMVTDEKE